MINFKEYILEKLLGMSELAVLSDKQKEKKE